MRRSGRLGPGNPELRVGIRRACRRHRARSGSADGGCSGTAENQTKISDYSLDTVKMFYEGAKGAGFVL